MNSSTIYRLSIKTIIKNEKWDILLMYNDKYWTWNLPWWWLEHWEKIEECINREIQEELWVKIKNIYPEPLWFITSDKWLNKEMPWIWNLIYNIDLENFKFTKSDECEKIWFFNNDTIENINIPENVKLIFNLIYIKNNNNN